MIGHFWLDLRYGARMLAKKQGFTIVAVIQQRHLQRSQQSLVAPTALSRFLAAGDHLDSLTGSQRSPGLAVARSILRDQIPEHGL